MASKELGVNEAESAVRAKLLDLKRTVNCNLSPYTESTLTLILYSYLVKMYSHCTDTALTLYSHCTHTMLTLY
jgi:hypothetical protein